MENIFVITASGSKPSERLNNTVENPIHKEKVEKYFSGEELENIRNIGMQYGYQLWGAKISSKNIWEIMQKGDHILVYQNKKYTYYTKVVYKTRNKDLAVELWDYDTDDSSWEYVYFLEKPIKFREPVDVSKFQPYLASAFQGLKHSKDERTEKIIADFGSVDKFFQTKLPELSKQKINIPNFWWVCQGDSFNLGRAKKVLKAPKITNPSFHWKNMENVIPGDIIFNYAFGYIQGISIAKSGCYVSEYEGKKADKGSDAYTIDIDFKVINKIHLPLLRNYLDYFKEKLGEKYSPFNKSGGVNQGYLFNFNYDAAKKIREIYGHPFPPPIEKYFLNLNLNGEDNNKIKDIRTALLIGKKQIILYGPPGTGKTYNTKKIAMNLLIQE